MATRSRAEQMAWHRCRRRRVRHRCGQRRRRATARRARGLRSCVLAVAAGGDRAVQPDLGRIRRLGLRGRPRLAVPVAVGRRRAVGCATASSSTTSACRASSSACWSAPRSPCPARSCRACSAIRWPIPASSASRPARASARCRSSCSAATVLAPLTALLGSFALPLAAFCGGLAATLVLYRDRDAAGPHLGRHHAACRHRARAPWPWPSPAS